MSKNDPASIKREATGHREPPSPEHEEQHTKSFPAQDASTNQAYFATAAKAPNRHAKPLGSATPAVNLNAPTAGKHFDHSLVQRARTSRK